MKESKAYMDGLSIINRRSAPKSETKKENPLNPIARQKHYEHYVSANYPYLTDDPDNVDTFTLGFRLGILHGLNEAERERQLREDTDKILKERIKELELQLANIGSDIDNHVKDFTNE